NHAQDRVIADAEVSSKRAPLCGVELVGVCASTHLQREIAVKASIFAGRHEIVEGRELELSRRSIKNRDIFCMRIRIASDHVERLPSEQARDVDQRLMDHISHPVDDTSERRAAVSFVFLRRKNTERLTHVFLMQAHYAFATLSIPTIDEQTWR